jgi:outer membrane receptor protein involved in Fe transport
MTLRNRYPTMTQNRSTPSASRRLRGPALLAALAAASAWLPALRAQAAASAPPPVPPAAVAPANGDQVVQMTPFDVTADKDNSYGAVNSNAITRFNVELSKLPVSADIFTQSFMDDIAATTVEGMVVADSAGAGISAIDAANASAQPGDHVAHNYVQLRGFDTAVMQRDSLMPVGPLFNPGSTAPGETSVFDTERVEVIDGPQALLYSGGGPGGVINVVSKQAYFGQAPTSTLLYRMDQYGSKYGQFDLNVGNDLVAVRVALLDDDSDTRRVNVGQQIDGEYVQLALKPFRNTTVRLNFEQTIENALTGDPGVGLSAQVTGDARAGLKLSYLLFTNQAGANTVNPATGTPNVAGAILGGALNWNNIDSQSGWQSAEYTKDTFETATIDTKWNDHLSTELAFGYNSVSYAFRAGAATLYAPTNSTNPTGNWAFGLTPTETDEPAVNKAVRYSIVDSEDFLGGNAKSQTILGADFVGSRAHSIAYSYFQADSNFNPIYSSAITTNNGRTALPTVYYPIGNGIVEYPLMKMGAGTFTVNGINYVRMVTNQTNPTLITAANPLGLSGSGLNEYNIVDNKGVFLTNMTQWLPDQKLTTLVGVRADDNFDSLLYSAPSYRVAQNKSLDYDLGANYALLPWLSPYFSVSNAVTPPQVLFPDPAGNLPQTGRGVGEEVGVKFSNQANTLSGSLAAYHSTGTNEEFDLNASVVSVINPTGLNGSYAGASGYTDLDRKSNGLEAILTASPTRNWRIRLSGALEDGRISNNAAYSPLYNDQFYANSLGQVTYKDGALVYVNANAFSSKTPVVSSTSAGATPLTIAMMNNASSLYYANPVNPNGAILSSSAVATVLKSTSATDGSILTGATGLPISDIQITPSFGIPKAITIFQSGQRTLGTPLYSVNLTNVYVFDRGWEKGIMLGGTVNAAINTVEYYYNPSTTITSATPALQPFSSPNSVTVNPIIGYEHEFPRVTFKAQLNITNLFNHYDVVLNPSQVTGYSVPANDTASFYGEPRLYTLSASFKY